MLTKYRKNNECIMRALEMARELTILADETDSECDDGCAVMSGIIRDCAYKIRNRAENEREGRKMQGIWDNGTTKGMAESPPSGRKGQA